MNQPKPATLKQVRIDPDVGEAFRRWCESTGRKMAPTATIAIKAYMEREGQAA